MSTYPLEPQKFTGHATLIGDDLDANVGIDFVLHRGTSGSFFSFQSSESSENSWLRAAMNSDNTMSLLGTLSDGEEVRCDDVGVTSGNYFSVDELAAGTLIPLSDVMIGQSQAYCVAMEVHLQGSLGIDVVTSILEYEVTISSVSVSKENRFLHSQQHAVLLATTVVRIESKLRPLDDFKNINESIARVLCLGLGRSMSVTHYRFVYADGTAHEQWHERTGYGGSLRSVVLKSCVEGFLQECVANYHNLQEKEKDKINLAGAYLTISENGFADLQALQVVQAWELYAQWESAAKTAESECPGEDLWVEDLVRDLRAYRKKVLAKKYPKMKAEQSIWDRLIKFLRKVNASDPMTELIKSSGLRADKLGLNLDLHVSLANSVRHSGVMSGEKSIWDRRRTIDVSRYALRLILLRTIGYTGLILFDDGGKFVKKDSILTFFEPKTGSREERVQQDDEAVT